MKNLLLCICFISFSLNSTAQNRAIKNFYHKYKKEDNTVNFVLPGFLVWLGTGIANEIVEEEEAKIFLRFAKKFKTMRFLVMEDQNTITAEDYNNLIAGARSSNYEELISVKQRGKQINIMGRGNSKKFKNLLILISQEDSFMMMSMKTKIKPKDLNRLINDLMKLDKVKEKIKKEEELPEPKEEKKKKPARA